MLTHIVYLVWDKRGLLYGAYCGGVQKLKRCIKGYLSTVELVGKTLQFGKIIIKLDLEKQLHISTSNFIPSKTNEKALNLKLRENGTMSRD